MGAAVLDAAGREISVLDYRLYGRRWAGSTAQKLVFVDKGGRNWFGLKIVGKPWDFGLAGEAGGGAGSRCARPGDSASVSFIGGMEETKDSCQI
jgi:hypothetical protein